MNNQEELIPSSRYKIIRWFKLDQFAPERAFTSYWVSSKIFFVIRFILSLYTTITLWTYFGAKVINKELGEFFVTFTSLTFIGLHAYLVTSTVHHYRYLRSGNFDFILHQPAFLNYLYVYLYHTVVVFNILTPVVFWSMIKEINIDKNNVVANWINISVHGITIIIMLIEVIFNRMTLINCMVLLVFLIALCYIFITFIIYACTSIWVYPFLDWSQGPIAAVYYFANVIMVIAIFFIMVLVHRLRDKVAIKLGRTTQTASKPEATELPSYSSSFTKQ